MNKRIRAKLAKKAGAWRLAGSLSLDGDVESAVAEIREPTPTQRFADLPRGNADQSRQGDNGVSRA